MKRHLIILLLPLLLLFTVRAQAELYACSLGSDVYHSLSCVEFAKIKQGKYITYNGEENAKANGLKPCSLCCGGAVAKPAPVTSVKSQQPASSAPAASGNDPAAGWAILLVVSLCLGVSCMALFLRNQTYGEAIRVLTVERNEARLKYDALLKMQGNGSERPKDHELRLSYEKGIADAHKNIDVQLKHERLIAYEEGFNDAREEIRSKLESRYEEFYLTAYADAQENIMQYLKDDFDEIYIQGYDAAKKYYYNLGYNDAVEHQNYRFDS